MQHVPTFGAQSVIAQKLVTGSTPDISGDVVSLGQDLLGAQSFTNDWAAAKDVGFELFLFGAGFKPIKAFQDAILNTFWHGGHGIILVVERQVIKNIFTFDIHAVHAF